MSASHAYSRLSDFSLFEQYCPSVLSIQLEGIKENEMLSSWRVKFNDGEMCWQERDQFDPDAFSIRFEQTEGDAEAFYGAWFVKPLSDEESEVHFSANFCLGIPSLADILEPIAEEALRDNVSEMIHQVFYTTPA